MTKEKDLSTLKYVDLSNERGLKEDYSDYRKRLRENYYKVKYYLKGSLYWDSLSNGTYRITKKEKKLLLECVEHVMSWESHMERASVTTIVKSKGLFGIDIEMPVTKLTTKYAALEKLEKKLREAA